MRSIPNIPIVYKTFPSNYVNDINGWAFDRNTVTKHAGALLTLDIDFGDTCTLNCPSCFRKNNIVDGFTEKTLNFDDLKKIIIDAKKLGLRTVKFLGAGDPFENFRFLEFLRFLYTESIIPLIFTKGHVIGDDELVKKYFSYLGIHTGQDLVAELDKCNVSIMLGFNSFDDKTQAKLVGAPVSYVQARNKTLLLLVENGFAKPNPTRLALALNPVTKQNLHEAYDIYEWGRRRNFYVIATPTMVSGRAKKSATRKAINPSDDELIELYFRIYSFNIENGLQTLEQIEREGISSYAGGHPCNQVSTGLYVTLGGTVLSCPGDVAVEGDVWENSIEKIWKKSSNYGRRGVFNNKCIAKDGDTIPNHLYSTVLRKLKTKYTLIQPLMPVREVCE